MLTLTEDIIIHSEPEKQEKNQISEKIFYNVSDSQIKLLQRVRLWNKNFTMRQILKKKTFSKSTILKKNVFLESTISEKNIILKSTIFKKKFNFRKRVSKITLHTKNHVLIHFPCKLRVFYRLRAILNSTILKKKNIFLKSTISKKKLFLKSMILK